MGDYDRFKNDEAVAEFYSTALTSLIEENNLKGDAMKAQIKEAVAGLLESMRVVVAEKKAEIYREAGLPLPQEMKSLV